jgi:hypothetical protein
MHNPIQILQQNLAPHREELFRHNIYQNIKNLQDLQVFMQHQVFAVWDAMSLLKSLQKELTCIIVPWVPTASPAVRRLINEMVLEEESGLGKHKKPSSHFELYLQAMRESGANTQPMQQFLEIIKANKSVFDALKIVAIPETVQEFVKHTFRLILEGKPHVIAAAFIFGREEIIPANFSQLISNLSFHFPGALDAFSYYLGRHIQLDEEIHTPLAMQMLAELCGNDAKKWQEAEEAIRSSIKARIKLWSGIRLELNS